MLKFAVSITYEESQREPSQVSKKSGINYIRCRQL